MESRRRDGKLSLHLLQPPISPDVQGFPWNKLLMFCQSDDTVGDYWSPRVTTPAPVLSTWQPVCQSGSDTGLVSDTSLMGDPSSYPKAAALSSYDKFNPAPSQHFLKNLVISLNSFDVLPEPRVLTRTLTLMSEVSPAQEKWSD